MQKAYFVEYTTQTFLLRKEKSAPGFIKSEEQADKSKRVN